LTANGTTPDPVAEKPIMVGRNANPGHAIAPEDLQSLFKHGVERKFGRGKPIYHKDDDPNSLWYVVEGRIQLIQTMASGREALSAFHMPGETFCVAAVLVGRPFPCRAVATVDSTVIEVSASHFKSLFDELPGFAKQLLTEMAPRLCESHCDCAMSVDTVNKRLAAVLLRLDKQFDGDNIPFTREEIAQMVGTTAETCTRVLSEWIRQGVIEGRRGKVRLIDRDALQDTIALP